MATTTNFGWSTPDDSANVKDGAAAIRSLGTAVDTTVATMVPKTIVDAKGDIIAATAADTVDRLAVGANNTVLTADSSAATGLKWATPASAIPANSSATVATSQNTTSTSYTDLATAGPAVTVTTGTKALVIVTSSINSSDTASSGFMSYAVSGATTIAASDSVATALRQAENYDGTTILNRSSAASVPTLTAGSNTFTAKYRVAPGGTQTFQDRSIFVINLA